MKDDETELAEDRSVRTLSRQPMSAGRVGTYAVLGAAVGTAPIPWLPDALARRIRGALAQDVAGRHGLSLTQEARDILAEPSGTEGPRGFFAQGMRFVTRRLLGRLTPLGFLPPVRAGLDTFVLGHLLHRYLESSRTERAVRIDVEEARRVRRAIDLAIVHAFSADIHTALEEVPAPSEELRDPVTKMIDGALITAAGLPGWILRRDRKSVV